MAQPKFVRVDDAGKITTPGVVQQMTDIAKSNGVPAGGTTGQVLQRSSTGAAAWGNAPSGLPAGGSAGQVVTRQADGTAAWAAGTPGPPGKDGKDGANWSKDQQAKAQGYWIVVSAEAPANATYTTADGTVVPVIWQKPIEMTVPVLPQVPAFSRASSTLSVPELVGVVYRITGWSKDLGSTWTPISKDLVGGAVTNVKTVTGQVLPLTVRVEALARPGYVMPATAAYTWTFDYPDPAATVAWTSATFATDGPLVGTSTSAGLGGTAKVYHSLTTATAAGGALVSGMAVFNMESTVNIEIEFDAMLTGDTGTGDPSVNVRLGTANSANDNTAKIHNSGAGVSIVRADTGLSRIYDASSNFYYGTLGTPSIAGHWKMSAIGNTLRVTTPNGSVKDYALTKATIGVAQRGSWVTISVGGPASVDNLVIKQVGY